MAAVRVFPAAGPDPAAVFLDRLAASIRGAHMHLGDPSVCITQAQIICVYSGKLGPGSPGRSRKRPPHVDFKGPRLSGSRWVSSIVGRRVGWSGWRKEGGVPFGHFRCSARKKGTVHVFMCMTGRKATLLTCSNYNAVKCK